MNNKLSDRDTIIVYKGSSDSLPEREGVGRWIAIAPVPVRFKGHSNVPDGTQGLAVGISKFAPNAIVVRANYPYYGNDVWAISPDHIEEVRE